MLQHRRRTFNPGFTQALNIESIISAPLEAAARANSMMLKEQTKFLMEFCFKKNDDDSYDPVLIEMYLTKSVADPDKDSDDPDYFRKMELSFNVPLITLIPINSLAVDKVTVEFDMEITEQSSSEIDYDKVNSKDIETPGEKAKLKGRVSYDSKENTKESLSGQNKSQNSAQLKVNINAGPLPLPVGLTTMLDMYLKSVHPNPVDNKKKSRDD